MGKQKMNDIIFLTMYAFVLYMIISASNQEDMIDTIFWIGVAVCGSILFYGKQQ